LAYLVSHRPSPAQLLWSAIFALVFLCLMPSAAQAQTVTQYTINQGAGGGNDITGATSCGNGANPFTPMIQNFVVGTSFTVSDVDLGFFASHGYRTDIRLVLESPAGTRVQIVNGATAGGNTNFNGLLNDDNFANPVVNTAGHGNDSLTPVPNPPATLYQKNLRPNNAFSAFDGELSIGTWRLEICDMFPGADNGNFRRADLFLTDTPPNADLSLTKSVSNTTPTSGSNVDYTLTVTNSGSSTLAATGVTVTDMLPAGVTYVSTVSGTGTYSSGTGIWTLGSVPIGASRSIVLRVNVTATAGATITNNAEIRTSAQVDIDSTPNNGSTGEDDDASVNFTVSGARVAGTPPTLVCPVGTTLFDWGTRTWPGSTATSQSQSYTVTNIGSITFDVDTDGTYLAPLTINGNNNGGIPGETGLYQFLDYTNISQATTTVLTLPTAVPGLQLRVFDVDFAAGDFADNIIVTGEFNGGSVSPILTNGISNYVAGNVAIGDATATNTTANGTIWITFSSPVDTVTIIYGNHTTAPANPDGQAASIHDITFCNPVANLSVTKISSVLSDGVSASNPKAIPGAIVQYCILITNAGSGTATLVSASDVIPADLSFITGSMRTGTNCGAAATVEDDNATGADESDPFGMSISGSTITGIAASLAPGANMALVFNATVD